MILTILRMIFRYMSSSSSDLANKLAAQANDLAERESCRAHPVRYSVDAFPIRAGADCFVTMFSTLSLSRIQHFVNECASTSTTMDSSKASQKDPNAI
jgi:hypothetical protein